MNDMQIIREILVTLAFLFAVPALVWGIPAVISKLKGPLTAHATVLSHRVTPGKWGGRYSDNWNRLITFQPKDGSELELSVSKEEYDAIADGQCGQITWREDILSYFDPDDPR